MKKLLLLLFTLVAATASAQGVGVTAPGYAHQYKLTADFTDGSGVTTAQNIPALAFPLPAGVAQTYYIECRLAYSQATVVADTFAIQFSNAPTAEMIGGVAATNATAFAAGTPNTTVDTATHTVVAMTPAVTTVLYAVLGGWVEMPSTTTDTTVNIQVSQATAANVVVIKRDSGCNVTATP